MIPQLINPWLRGPHYHGTYMVVEIGGTRTCMMRPTSRSPHRRKQTPLLGTLRRARSTLGHIRRCRPRENKCHAGAGLQNMIATWFLDRTPHQHSKAGHYSGASRIDIVAQSRVFSRQMKTPCNEKHSECTRNTIDIS